MKPTEFTRQSLLDHATSVFAERGFEGASVREITRRADAIRPRSPIISAAGDPLYLEVLKLAVLALSDAALLDEEIVERVSRGRRCVSSYVSR